MNELIVFGRGREGRGGKLGSQGIVGMEGPTLKCY